LLRCRGGAVLKKKKKKTKTGNYPTASRIPFSLEFEVAETAESRRTIATLTAEIGDTPHAAHLGELCALASKDRSPRLFLTELARYGRFVAARRRAFASVLAAHPGGAVAAPLGTALSETLHVGAPGAQLAFVASWTCRLENGRMTERIAAHPIATQPSKGLHSFWFFFFFWFFGFFSS
jgi:hypothetical protein